jgi:hypothetical protein
VAHDLGLAVDRIWRGGWAAFGIEPDRGEQL